MAAKFDAERYVAGLRSRYLPSDIVITLKETDAPGGDPDNFAHVHALPILNDFLLQYDPDADDDGLRLTLTHEVLHVAFRHVGGAITALKETQPLAAAFVERALEEDVEALARRLYK